MSIFFIIFLSAALNLLFCTVMKMRHIAEEVKFDGMTQTYLILFSAGLLWLKKFSISKSVAIGKFSIQFNGSLFPTVHIFPKCVIYHFACLICPLSNYCRHKFIVANLIALQLLNCKD